MNIQTSEEINVAILAGGLGTRLKLKLRRKPKVLAKIGEYPFLEYLLSQLNRANFKKVVLCTGYLGDQIKKRFGESYKGLKILYSQEQKLLGTAGAIRNALPLFNSDAILLMNGDSYCSIDFKKFIEFHFIKKSNVSMAITFVSNVSQHGQLRISKDASIISFQEKIKKNRKGLVNAGIYLINKSFIEEIPENRNISIEKEVFPNWIGRGFYGYETTDKFIDIGTPESYTQAAKFFKRFIILDRDGTIIEEKDHLVNINDVKLIPNAANSIKKLKKEGFGIIVLTNQSVVGRGHISNSDLELIHKKMLKLLLQKGAKLDSIYVCPHIPKDNCLCRKPKIGLVENALKDHNFDPKLAFVVGDNKSDIELGKNIGAITILVRTGYGKKVEKEVSPDFVINDMKNLLPLIKRVISLSQVIFIFYIPFDCFSYSFF